MQNPSVKFIATPSLVSPRNFTAKVPTMTNFSWDKVGFATKYRIQIAENNIFGIKAIDETVDNGKTLFKTELVDGRHYYWRVRAMNDSMTSAWSSVWSFICGAPSYNDIQLVKPDNNSKNLGNQITFNWTNIKFTNLSFKPYTTYKFQLSENSDFNSITLETEFIHDSVYSISEVTKASTQYYWRVAPVVEGVQGNWSGVFTFTTLGLPAKITLLEPSDGAVNVNVKGGLNWTLNPSADSYWVQISESVDFGSLKFERKNASKPPLNLLPKLDYEKKYYWRVAGMNEAGEGPWSDIWSFTTEKGVGVNEQSPDFNWIIAPNPANESLRIEIDCSSKFDYRANSPKLYLYDLNGNLLYELTPGAIIGEKIRLEMITKSIRAGSYFIKLKADKFEDSKKIVIIH
jgi:hypothetical protein